MHDENLIAQLINVYYHEEYWVKRKMSVDKIRRYFNILLNNGNIITVERDKELLGYVEFWLINENQFSKLQRGGNLRPETEDVQTGNICYLNSLWIKNTERKGEVFKMMKKRFFEATRHCTLYCGVENKHNKRFRMLRR